MVKYLCDWCDKEKKIDQLYHVEKADFTEPVSARRQICVDCLEQVKTKELQTTF